MNEVLIGRQPIFTREKEVIGYELLYRSHAGPAAQITDGVAATNSVLARTFMDIGLQRLVGENLAFFNLPQELLRGDLEMPCEPSQIVLEVLEGVSIDGAVIEEIKTLREKGFRVALDDVINVDTIREVAPWIDIVKIDVLHVDRSTLPQMLDWLRQFPLTLIAEKVETADDFNYCFELGFDWFQGYFFSQPAIVREPKIASSALVILQILGMINSEGIGMDEFERMAVQDAALTFKVLRLINSAAFALNSEVTSIKQALSMLGLRKLRSLLTFMLHEHAQDRPLELSKLAVLRGEMAEKILEIAQVQIPGAFTVGMFSTMEALLGIPLPTALQQVPLSIEIKNALLYRQGVLGDVLSCVLAFERADWNEVRLMGLSNAQIQECFLQAAQAADANAALFDAT
ncbi:MAG TPA: EAL domain-containing protein [Pirellulaceae bacterium]|nr:EAL domain-containing protein [Pirellulaceae bacterium]